MITQHVYPIDDLRDHVVDGYPKLECWCHPRVEGVYGDRIVIHNSMDQRERYETGELRPH